MQGGSFMLSTKAFSSTANALSYYSHADYYGEEAKGEWYGAEAHELGLKGKFEARNNQSFERIFLTSAVF